MRYNDFQEQFWDIIMQDETEIFIPVHKNINNNRVVLFLDQGSKKKNNNEVRVFLNDDEMQSYLSNSDADEDVAFARFNLGKLYKSMANLSNKKPELRISVVLYAMDISKKMYKIDTLWPFIEN